MRCIDWNTRLGAVALLPVLLAGCMLGPDYVKPEVARDALQAPALHRAGAAEVIATAPANRWWDELHDVELSWLVDQALANSPSLRVASARVRAARELSAQRRAERLPQVGAVAGGGYVKAPEGVADTVRGVGGNLAAADPQAGQAVREAADDLETDLYLAGFDASWELDFFGRRRRAAEQTAAEAEASAAELADAQVQLAAEVGQVYANYRGLQARLDIAKRTEAASRQALALTEQRRAGGAATELEVERARGQLQQNQATQLPLEAQRDAALDQLALMIGREPGALDQRLAAVAPLPTLPQQVKVDDPAALIRRRPDVRQAERALAGSNAQIGQALSAYFPQVILFGNLAAVATSPGDLGADSAATLVAPFLRWSLLDFGRIRAQVAQARAGTEARTAAYEGTVLAALQDANTALSNYGAARRQVAVAQQAQSTADRSAMLMQQRYAAGASSLIDALDVQRQQLGAHDSAALAQVQQVVNYIALQKSLGLGWSDGDPVARTD